MIGGDFQHDICSVQNNIPRHIIWNKTNHTGNISIHIDSAVFNIPTNKQKINCAWFCESPYYTKHLEDQFDNPQLKRYILESYKYVFSCNKSFIKKHPEVKYVIPTACPWVTDRQIFIKTKLASIIASYKRETPGHLFRHIIIDTYKDWVDVFGTGYTPIETKNVGLNDYMFSFTIENIKSDGYFTEKIADCFATGTIPIYWGDETIFDYFLEDGIVRIGNDFDPSILSEELYRSKIAFITENYHKIMKFPCPEDYIYLNYVQKLG